MHTDNLRKLALETNDGVLRGPAFDAADEIDRLRAEIDWLTKERQAFEGMAKDNYDRLQKAEAERDEARAQVAGGRVQPPQPSVSVSCPAPTPDDET